MNGKGESSSALPGNSQPGYTFAGLRLEPDGTLFRGPAAIHLAPQELAALRLLLAHAGQIVTPLQLRHALWGDVHVSDDSVPKCISSLRSRLEPDDCIQTVYKRGYRLAAEVRSLDAAPAGVLPRLAVMPFATGYGVPEHLGSAVAEETIARLANLRGPVAAVLARDSVFTLARQGITAQRLGEMLRADMVLTGTLRALPAHFRLRAEMVCVADNTQAWVEDLLVERTRVGGLESELVELLLFRMNAGTPVDWSLSPGMNGEGLDLAAAEAPAQEASAALAQREAYEIFQRARYEWQSLERHRMQDSLQGLLHAAEIDPALIAAKIELVQLCVTQAYYGYMAPAVAADLARRTADSIPDIGHRAEVILPALGWINFHVDYNLSAALWAFSRSAHLPHSTLITRERVMFALSRLRFDEAVALLRAALEQDPYAPWLHGRLAWTLHLAGQAEESLQRIRHSLDLFPGHDGAAFYGSMILACNGEAARGAELAEDLVRRQPYVDLLKSVHAYALAMAGRKDEAYVILERQQWLSRERFVMSSFNATAYAALGDQPAALMELRTAERDRCPWFFQLLADPRLKPLHSDPEFVRLRAILTRMEEAAAHEPAPPE